jgi:uncharacterized membrane protein
MDSTGRVDLALDFALAANAFAFLGYFLHERLWARIRWARAVTP